MKTLHLFGDSFTEGHLRDKHYTPYKEWKLYNELANNLTEISLNVNKHVYNELYPR